METEANHAAACQSANGQQMIASRRHADAVTIGLLRQPRAERSAGACLRRRVRGPVRYPATARLGRGQLRWLQPDIGATVADLAARGLLIMRRRPPAPDDFTGAALVVPATGCR